jgi:holo-ACP synthase/triphosphoribosyl-dephospho-CoA synthase
LGEVSVTPKPGLVDRHDSGSHKDMDFFTFVDSASALAPWFCAFFRAGWEDEGDLFSSLRALGQQAERVMFAATGGVNTHQGLIFSMAIFCGAVGAASAAAFPAAPTREDVTERIRALGSASLGDFAAADPSTAGLRYYRDHGVTGIRGEAASGYPAVFEIGLPALQHHLAQGLSRNDAAAAALLSLMAAVEDTNMIHRGGIAEACRRREEAAAALKGLSGETLHRVLREMNEDYIRCSLSPGGCGDLLALTLFAHFLKL